MIVSDKHKLIVTLPQKCATGTLQLRLSEIRDLEPYAQVGGWYSKELGKLVYKHMEVEDIVKLKDYKLRRNFSRACFVRNPYDRVYSWFQWFYFAKKKMVESGKLDFAKRQLASNDDARGVHLAYVRNFEWMEQALAKCDGDFNEFLRVNQHCYSLASNFTHHRGKMWVHFLGRVETFERDFKEFYELYKLSINLFDNDDKSFNASEMSHRIPRTREDHKYLSRYNDESIKIVNEIMKDDFELLGYNKF
jgi:hypothetical protein